ncbi:MAG: T9SS C-terminal target domain-containing protein [Bacteroidetes bacterium]|nr:MAG: T9SS C-terminal target domain-containing protein [Bacteroidota bacterium]
MFMQFYRFLILITIQSFFFIAVSANGVNGKELKHHQGCCEDSGFHKTHDSIIHRCGSELYREIQESRYPEIRLKRRQIEKDTEAWLLKNAEKTIHNLDVVTIPVVVHVVYNENQPLQNISEEQILSQIDALNDDFRRFNADTVNTPDIFQSIAADSRIEFRLARRAPDGTPTNGITRTSTKIQSFSFDTDDVKFDDKGGKSIWNRDQYLNIWVCNLEANYLGYAQYPGGPAATDGIVISYRNFGTLGTAQFPFNQGRTLTHEVGHWFNLVHTWGDEDNCDATDFVPDTPTQETAYYHCPSFPQVSCDSEDMFMNYMDYTDDRCMNLFTIGQANRMQATLNGFRAPIKNSNALVAPEFAYAYCDTLNTDVKNGPLYLYLASDGGYATGTNVYNDKAKAQFFKNENEFTIIEGGVMAFGAAFDKGGNAYAAVWETGADGKPAANPVRQKTLLVSDIKQDVHNARFTHFFFDPVVVVDGPFFMGVILPGEDTLALYASVTQETTNAWELWENNIWYNFEDSWNGTLNVELAVFPLVCKLLPPYQPGQPVELAIGPNPLKLNLLNLYLSNFPDNEPLNIEIYDISGRKVFQYTTETASYITLDLSTISTQGLFIIKLHNNYFQITDKFLRIRADAQ